ncbi:hypothetical protein B0T14DRAFT_31534 [Immersiella caudata]|uniref:Uncharacterized protein n=1 Tax=Immersiella caudata TaxID=314043 RepID=A0AA39XFE9_9PEZI|nr:hypothetical protein B0T14DRAFT_31534 [Immersiella caudata]
MWWVVCCLLLPHSPPPPIPRGTGRFGGSASLHDTSLPGRIAFNRVLGYRDNTPSLAIKTPKVDIAVSSAHVLQCSIYSGGRWRLNCAGYRSGLLGTSPPGIQIQSCRGTLVDQMLIEETWWALGPTF